MTYDTRTDSNRPVDVILFLIIRFVAGFAQAACEVFNEQHLVIGPMRIVAAGAIILCDRLVNGRPQTKRVAVCTQIASGFGESEQMVAGDGVFVAIQALTFGGRLMHDGPVKNLSMT